LELWRSAPLITVFKASPVPSLFVDIYRCGELETGISYLTIAVAVGGYPNGKFLERNYRAVAKRIGFTINKVSGDGITKFLTERAEARFAFYLIAVHTVLLVD